MHKVKVGELEAGMVLATDVDDRNGYRILARGTVLTDSQIELLTGWRVFEVAVEEEMAGREEVEQAKSDEQHAIEAAKRRLKEQFEGSLVNPWMESLYREAEARLEVPRYWKTGC
ncbi:MAG: hypothetical protein ACYTAN_09445 [Planctomycetota bacterium]|jgi:hypothetical protein